ncbi:MAG: amino acid permease [Proteobacteria bacterium]|nr:amino acid permease [Pseudomonadota bacterium]
MVLKTSSTQPHSNTDGKFGTFKGVFTPSVLTILGVIMYLRFGWVVGNGGLIGAVLVVLLAHAISITTGMSISSIATNLKVKTGGDYYMISRSLGLPVGGAIGIALFFALALSMSLYLLGFAESFLDAFHFENTINARRLVGSLACLALTGLTFFSTSLALRIQYIVLACIVLSLVSLFLGDAPNPTEAAPLKLWFSADSESFQTLFAVFFPAVTGFTAGVAMSGDLKNPRFSIPFGTMAAILFGLVVYLTIPVFLGLQADPVALREKPMIWMDIAMIPELVIAGIFAATLSSALGSVLGSPRYLQALAMDGVVPRFLGKGYGKLNEPRIGTVCTFMIAQAGIMVGELDLIARIITMFFLTSYGVLNLASGIQAWSGIPSYRPDFKTPSWVSFAGALTCAAIMFKLDTLAMISAAVVMSAVYFFLKRRQFRTSPGDTWGGFWAAVVQFGILHLHGRAVDSLNWRPNAIVFGGPPSERKHLIHLSRWLVQGRGLCTYYYLVEGNIQEEIEHTREIEPSVRDIVSTIYPEMLSRVSVCRNIYDGIVNVTQSYGLSGMVPNTVIMGFAEHSKVPEEFSKLVRDILTLNDNLFLYRYDPDRACGVHKTIDIWWGGLERNGSMMLLLSFLLTSSEDWSDAKVRINVVVDSERKTKPTQRNLSQIIEKSRVKAEPNVILNPSRKHPIATIMANVSSDTDLTLIGIRPPSLDGEDNFVERINSLIDGLGSVLLVRASTQFDGIELMFDDE